MSYTEVMLEINNMDNIMYTEYLLIINNDIYSPISVEGNYNILMIGSGDDDISDDDIMDMVLRESLNSYKNQEKKPNVKLCIGEKTVNQNIVDKKDICTICVNSFELDENINELECKHLFHTSCLSEWVKYKSDCPVCRHCIHTVEEFPSVM
jgi:E3 ubiquitin-protein ligase RNF115/126